MTSADTITIKYLTEVDELAHWYPQQTAPQPCLVALSLEGGELTADYNPEIGNGIPASVYHHRTLWFDIPALTADAANAFLDEIAPLARRILAGSEVEWDGHNRVGRQTTDDARAARDELAAACARLAEDPGAQTIQWYDAGDWFEPEGQDTIAQRLGITPDTDDLTIGRLAEQEEAEALEQSGGPYLLRGTDEYLTDLRNELRDQARDELIEVAEQIDTLTERRDELIRRQLGWGDPSRAVAERARLSHTHVQRIGRTPGVVAFPTADLAEFLAGIFAGNDFAVTVDDTTVTLGPDALAHLAARTGDEDGHYDGRHVWIAGSEYTVRF